MVGWHHPHDGHEFESTPGVGDGQGGLACCSPWEHKESETTERLNWIEQPHPVPRTLTSRRLGWAEVGDQGVSLPVTKCHLCLPHWVSLAGLLSCLSLDFPDSEQGLTTGPAPAVRISPPSAGLS